MRSSPCFAQGEDYRAIRHSERQNGTILRLADEGQQWQTDKTDPALRLSTRAKHMDPA